MRLYTYFRATEKAYMRAEIYNNEYFWNRHQHLRDGLIKRMERIELNNIMLKDRIEYWKDKHDELETAMASQE